MVRGAENRNVGTAAIDVKTNDLGVLSRRPRSEVRMAWRQFRRNHGAVCGLIAVTLIVLIGIFAWKLMPHDPYEINGAVRRQGIGVEAWLGYDELGRDMLSRIILGTRLALTVAVFAVAVGLTIGTLLGLAAGYFGGKVDLVISAIIDLMLAFPSLLLAIVIVAALGPGVHNAAFAIGISAIPVYARIVRGSTISARHSDYIDAAQVLGARAPRIVSRHILPNILSPIIVISTIQLARAILTESSLSFLGLGAQPPLPDWGAMAATGRSYLTTNPHIVLVPSAAIMITVIAFNLVGDGLRDALDPRLRTNG